MDAGVQAESSPFFTPDKPQHSFTRCEGRVEGGSPSDVSVTQGRKGRIGNVGENISVV